jgi:translation initiation factor 4G
VLTGQVKRKNGKTPPKRSSSSSVAQQKQQQQPKKPSQRPPKLLSEIFLLNATGAGKTDAEKRIVRYSADALLGLRLKYTDPPPADRGHWTPHERCLWTGRGRVATIEREHAKVFNYKPLEVNDDTRWRAKVMKGGGSEEDDADREERIRQRIVAILNKLSWTNLDRLTVQFLETMGGAGDSETEISQHTVRGTMLLVVEKAMREPHFAELYARLSAKLAAVHKTFKRTVLALCQEEFEETDKREHADLPEDPAERELELNQARKQSIGLMKFIGELYKEKLIKGAIMIGCLVRLLVPEDEEKLECFSKLMTTIGYRLHEEEPKLSKSEDLGEPEELVHIWDQVYSMAGKKNLDPPGPKAPSNRIKFLLHDLIELKENGWVQRRKEEKAKTIAQIHKEVAQEQAMQRRPSKQNLRRSVSSGPLQRPPKAQQQPVQDDDGFVQIPNKPKRTSLRRVKSDSVTSALQSAAAHRNKSWSGTTNGSSTHRAPTPPSRQRSISPTLQEVIVEHVEPKECGEKTKTILKEFFVGGDSDDAVLSIDELVCKGATGHVERGAAVVEAGTLLVMEMKEQDARKFLEVIGRCLTESKLDAACLSVGLNDPLEFLRDIEIDAPLAANLLAIIIAEWMQLKLPNGSAALSLEFLKAAPEFFRTDGRPAAFAAQILSKRGGDVTDAEVRVVESLLTKDEKKEHSSATAFLESLISKS